MTDREIIEWVAQAEVGLQLPVGVAQGDIAKALARQGFVADPDLPVAEVAPRASAWAREWLRSS